MKLFYTLSPDISLIPISDEAVLFKSETVSGKLEGKSLKLFLSEILPLLNEENDIDEICEKIPGLSPENLKEHLDGLLNAGILIQGEKPVSSSALQITPTFFNNFLNSQGIQTSAAAKTLTEFKVGIIGLEAHGMQVLLGLQQSGLRDFKVIDPFPCDENFFLTFPFLRNSDSPKFRQDCVADYLKSSTGGLVQCGPEILSKESLEKFVDDRHLVIVCVDKGFSAIYYWINEIGKEKSIALFYGFVSGNKCTIGPFVIPDETSCYMCFKIREAEAVEDYDEAMKYEEHLIKQKSTSFRREKSLPSNLHLVSGVICTEVIKFIFNLRPLSLVNCIMEFDAVHLRSTIHPILESPDCPVCKKKTERRHFSFSSLLEQHPPGDKIEIQKVLVSTRTGIVTKLVKVEKNITEAILPYIFRASICNHKHWPKDGEKLNGSGKGMTIGDAQISALGEATEVYAATKIFPDEISYSSFNKVRGRALDPRKLVLYSDSQYKGLPYLPFEEELVIGWVKALSLNSDKEIYVPADSIFLVNTSPDKKTLCELTSNGLAAGGTLLYAILQASLEVLERDAFMIAWYNKLPCLRIDPLTCPDQHIHHLYESHIRRGVELQLYRLPTDGPCHVFMCIGVQKKGTGPTISVGLGADFSPVKAALKACIEFGQVRHSLKRSMPVSAVQQRTLQLIKDPRTVTRIEDHALLYSVPQWLDAFNFLMDQPLSVFSWAATEQTIHQQLEEIKQYVTSIESDLIYYNLSVSDLVQVGMYNCRVIIPELQPIHFGYKTIRLNGKRLFELPVHLGYRKHRISPSEINIYPHPLM